jgi:hypothetical protein
MEQRVAKLETDANEIKATLGRHEPILTRIDTSTRKLEADVGELKGRVAQMPTAWQLLVGIIGIMGATFGLLKMALPH